MDKKLKWSYKIDMLKDTTFIKATLAVFAISAGFVGLFMFFITLGDGFFQAAKVGGLIFLGLAAGLSVLAVIAFYVFYVPIMGRYYGVIFELDDNSAIFISDKKTTAKASKISNFAIAAGIATTNLSLMGQGFIASARTNMTTKLKGVTKIVFKPSIKRITLVESRVATNFIYVPHELWNEVESHLIEKCTKAKVRYK